jgi:uncharacterized membrane protein YphA (DoxX/SURF4 family)
MTIISLILNIGLVAILLTALIYFFNKKINLIDSFLQNFCGALFIFSGWVKAIDPMGTGFKLEQYFQQFESTFAGTWMKFIAPIFPLLEKFSLSFSIFMIVLEIVLGIMLIIGAYRKVTAWLFFGIILFFTALTGYTFLTGYVPDGVNFFDFKNWGLYSDNNMKVKDCGCFGDFIKLEPKVSFFKDIFLLLPAIWFLFRWRKLHQLFSGSLRNSITGFATLGLILFCLSNFVWNEPMIDFRPFKKGVNIKEQLANEKKAAADVEITAWSLKNKNNGELKIVPNEEYMKNFSKYPKAEWSVVDQVKSKPAVPITKISDFEITDATNNSVTDLILDDNKNALVVISPKVKYTTKSEKITVSDSIFVQDSIFYGKKKDSVRIENRFSHVDNKEVKKTIYSWDSEFLSRMKNDILPFIDSLKGDNVTYYAIIGGISEEALLDLKKTIGIEMPYYMADDILLKTIMRSNPGILHLRAGSVINKWHYRQLPEIKEVKEHQFHYNSLKLY